MTVEMKDCHFLFWFLMRVVVSWGVWWFLEIKNWFWERMNLQELERDEVFILISEVVMGGFC